MQMREIRFAAIMIAHVLNFRVRSTGLTDTVCVLKQPHNSARFSGWEWSYRLLAIRLSAILHRLYPSVADP